MITPIHRATASLLGLAVGSALIVTAGSAAAAPAKPAPASSYSAARNIAQMPTVSQGVIQQQVINVSGLRAAYEVSCAQTSTRAIYRIAGTGAVVVVLPELSKTGPMELVGLVGASAVVRSGCLTDATQNWSSLLGTNFGTYSQPVSVDSIPPTPPGTLHALLPGQRPSGSGATTAPTPALLALESRLGPDAATAPSLDGKPTQTIAITGMAAAAVVSCENSPSRLIYRLPVKDDSAINVPIFRTSLTYRTSASSNVDGGGPGTFGNPVAVVAFSNTGKVLADSGCFSNSDTAPAQTALAWGSSGDLISGPAARPIGAGVPPYIPTPTSQLVTAHLVPHATGVTAPLIQCAACATLGPPPQVGQSYNLGGGVGIGHSFLAVVALILMLITGFSSHRRNRRERSEEGARGRRNGQGRLGQVSVFLTVAIGAVTALSSGSLPITLAASVIAGFVLLERLTSKAGTRLRSLGSYSSMDWGRAGIYAAVAGVIAGFASNALTGSLVTGGIYGTVVGGCAAMALGHVKAKGVAEQTMARDTRVIVGILKLKDTESLLDGSIDWAWHSSGGFQIAYPDAKFTFDERGIAERCALAKPPMAIGRFDDDFIVIIPASAAAIAGQRATADSGGHLGGQSTRTDPWAERPSRPTPAPAPAVSMTKPTDTPTTPATKPPIDFSQDW